MSLSKRVVETLVDLVEIKLSCLEVYDREDSRELAALEQCRDELDTVLRNTAAEADSPIVVFGSGRKRQARATA